MTVQKILIFDFYIWKRVRWPIWCLCWFVLMISCPLGKVLQVIGLSISRCTSYRYITLNTHNEVSRLKGATLIDICWAMHCCGYRSQVKTMQDDKFSHLKIPDEARKVSRLQYKLVSEQHSATCEVVSSAMGNFRTFTAKAEKAPPHLLCLNGE